MNRPVITCNWTDGAFRKYASISAKFITKVSRLFRSRPKDTEYCVSIEMKSLAFSEQDIGTIELKISSTLTEDFDNDIELHCIDYCYYPSLKTNSSGRTEGEVNTSAETVFVQLKTRGDCGITIEQVFVEIQAALDECEDCSFFWEEPSIY